MTGFKLKIHFQIRSTNLTLTFQFNIKDESYSVARSSLDLRGTLRRELNKRLKITVKLISIQPRFCRDYQPVNLKNCPINTLMTVDLKIPKSNINGMTMSGWIDVKKEIQGNMELVLEANRCTLDMKNCEKYPGTTFRDLCSKFDDKNAFYSPFLESFEPPLKCPMKPGNYTIHEIKLDYTLFSALALDGYIWLTTFKILASEAATKKKRIVACLNTELKIVRCNKRKF